MTRTLTGGHVAAMFAGGFAIIIGVNVALAVSAVRTFPGLETKNSYVASQTFDAERAAQENLDWVVTAQVIGDTLTLQAVKKDAPVHLNVVSATLGRATHVRDDRALTFVFDGTVYTAPVPDLAPGNWNLRLVALAEDGTRFRRRIPLVVRR